MKLKNVVLIIILLICSTSCLGKLLDSLVAKQFINHLKEQDFTKAYALVDEHVREKLSSSLLENTWAQLTSSTGKLTHIADAYKEKLGNQACFYFPCQFEKQLLDLKVVVTSGDKIGGFYFLPHGEHVYHLPDYAKPGHYLEQAIVVDSDNIHKLDGTLTLPNNLDQPVPVIVLLHGSGPNDQDEAIGPNKMFKDLAIGLANFGIATLRYNKRTYSYPGDYKNGITIREEVIEDALSAINMCKLIPQINSKEIYLAGHSFGGMLASEIGLEAKTLRGLILLAANNSPLEDLIYKQYQYQFDLDGKRSEEENNQLKLMRAQIRYLNSDKLTLSSPVDSLPLSIPASYWLDLKSHDPLKSYAALQKKCLVLQGERDYQVPRADYQMWKSFTSTKDNISAASFPKLNHFFMEGEGKPSPEEYTKPQHVSYEVIERIAHWLDE